MHYHQDQETRLRSITEKETQKPENHHTTFLFSDRFWKMKEKFSTQMVRFLNPMFVNCAHHKRCWPISFTCWKKFENPKLFVWTRKMQFWQSCRKIIVGGPKKFAQSPKITIELYINFSSIFFLKMFHWTYKMRIWQQCREFFVFYLKKCCIMSKTSCFKIG